MKNKNLEQKFKYIGQFNDGLALAKDENYVYKFIDINGQIIFDVKEKIESQIPQEKILGFENIKDFNDGFAIIEYLNHEYLSRTTAIDTHGNIIIAPDKIKKIEYGDGLFLCTGKDNYHFYVDKKGYLAIQEKFHIATPFENGVATVGNYYSQYMIDKQGNILKQIKGEENKVHEKTICLEPKK